MLEPKDIISQIDLADAYRTFYPNTIEYVSFLVTHGIVSKLTRRLDTKHVLADTRQWK